MDTEVSFNVRSIFNGWLIESFGTYNRKTVFVEDEEDVGQAIESLIAELLSSREEEVREFEEERISLTEAGWGYLVGDSAPSA